MISYKPLWSLLEQKGISQYQLLKLGIDNRTLNYLKHDKNITMYTLEKICTILGCEPNDVVSFEEK